jgi:ATP-dependent DNA ligase
MGSKRENIMLAHPVDEKKIKKLPEMVYFQKKYNGERVRVEWTPSGPRLISSCGNEMPFFRKIKEELCSRGLEGYALDGELYSHGMEREEIHSIASRRVNPHPDEGKLTLHAFDLIVYNGQPQTARLSVLHSILAKEKGERVISADTFYDNKSQLMYFAELFTKESFEGVIIRHPGALYTPRKCNYLLKFKPTARDTYPIIGYKEEEDIYGQPKGRLGSVIVRDNDGNTFSVGTGKALDDDGRRFWWRHRNLLTSRTATVKHSTIMTVNGYPTCTSLLEISIGNEVPD